MGDISQILLNRLGVFPQFEDKNRRVWWALLPGKETIWLAVVSKPLFEPFCNLLFQGAWRSGALVPKEI
jgi:hypothetical protein